MNEELISKMNEEDVTFLNARVSCREAQEQYDNALSEVAKTIGNLQLPVNELQSFWKQVEKKLTVMYTEDPPSYSGHMWFQV